MKKERFDQLVESIEEMKAVERGERAPSRQFDIDPNDPDVVAIRNRLALSQGKFATLLGISVNTLQNWEQRRRRPDGPARVLLRVAAESPEAILKTTRGASAIMMVKERPAPAAQPRRIAARKGLEGGGAGTVIIKRSTLRAPQTMAASAHTQRKPKRAKS